MLIDRDKLLRLAKSERKTCGKDYDFYGLLFDIEYAPIVDAMPVKHGQWMHLDQSEYATISGKCSCCGWEAHYYEDDVADMPYCPNCGAKMDLERQNATD